MVTLRHVSVLAAATAVAAVEFRFTNKCDYTINLHGGGSKFICDIAPGVKVGNNCGSTLSNIGLFKHSPSNEANLIEYSLINSGFGLNQVWYDVSNIPPGPGWCSSYEDCKAFTGRKGYNVPVLVIPTKHKGKANCKQLYVTRPDAPDAYLFPADNTKTHDCPMDEVFDVIFCPDNAAPAPPTNPPVVTTKAPSPPAPTSPPATSAAPTNPPVTKAPTTATPPPYVAPSTTSAPATSTSKPATPSVVPVPTSATTSPPPVYSTSPPVPSPSNNDGYIKAWYQCGGKGYSGKSVCGTGHSCVAVNDWFSQCVPEAPKFGELNTWSQCGGTGFDGKASCLARDACVKLNEYFYQCQPKASK